MGAVAARDDETLEGLRGPVAVGVRDAGPVGLDVVQANIGDLEVERIPGRETCMDEVLNDFGLSVRPDRAPAEGCEMEALAVSGPLQIDAVVPQALAVKPLADTSLGEDLYGGLLEDSGADPC